MSEGTEALNRVIKKMETLAQTDKIIRKVATSIHTKLEERIFQPSTKDKNNTPVGSRGGLYSENYILLRRRAGYMGRDATNVELSGVTKTEGTKKNTSAGKGARGINKYKTSGQMRSDFKVRAGTTESGQPTWGHGFSNQFNYDKSLWVEKRYRTKIFTLTEAEKKQAIDMIDRNIREIIG